MAEKSELPFPEALQELLDDNWIQVGSEWVREPISGAELARRVRERGWGSQWTVSVLMRGELKPTMHAMENIAAVLDEKPEFFAEYRLAKARQRLDPNVVGLRKALKNLGE